MIELHNIAMEQCVLMALMTVQNSLEVVSNDLTKDSFHADRHKLIFQSITDLSNESKPYDVLLVEQKLNDSKLLALAGGSEYLSQILNESASSFYNLETYVAQLNKLKSHRDLESLGQQMIALSRDLTKEDVFTDAEGLFSSVDITGEQKKTSFTFEEAIKSATELLVAKAEAKHKKEFTGVQFNISHLDHLVGAIKKGHLCVIGGRPGSGKSTLAQMLTIQTALRYSKPVLFISAEMDKDTLTNRMISALSSIPYDNIHNATLYDGMLEQYSTATYQYQRLQIHIEDKQQPTISEVRAYARKAKRKYKNLGCIVIDYLQLLRDPSVKDRIQEVASISRKLKAMAKEFECPIIALGQLNRDSEGTGKRPKAHNLKDSGQIEQDADQIILVHPIVEKEDQMPTGITELIVDKNRHGKKGIVKVRDRLEICRFMGIVEGDV